MTRIVLFLIHQMNTVDAKRMREGRKLNIADIHDLTCLFLLR